MLPAAGVHLPTAQSPYASEPCVFLSSDLVGSIYTPLMAQRGHADVRGRLFRRARKLYGYAAILLLIMFTAASSPFLTCQPSLLDILTMYIVFVLLAPALLCVGERRGWSWLLVRSGALWGLAQLQGAQGRYESVASIGLPRSLVALGAFSRFAWQLVWVGGFWIGSGQ